jgi:Glycosyl hydrolases family 43
MRFNFQKRIRCWFVVLICFSGLSALSVSAQSYSQFTNGAVTEHVAWSDNKGNLINAHDGGIIFAGGKYHWYGMALRPLPVANGPDGGQKTTVGVVMYSSSDLYNWTDEGVILACSPDPASPLHGPMRFERPKIIYNKSTRQYVMWFHYVGYPGDHGTKIGSGEAGAAVSSKVNGPYTFKGYSRPIDANGVVRDSTLFQDEDGAAYFIYDRDVPQPNPDAGRVLHIVKLTSDYLGFSSTYYEIANASRREAPVMFKHNGFYFLITSAETGWKNNAANYYRSTSIMGPYTELENPCVGPDPELTFDAQGTYAFPVQGKKSEIVFLAERHITTRMTDSSYIFLPIRFPTSSTLELQYLSAWRLADWPQ